MSERERPEWERKEKVVLKYSPSDMLLGALQEIANKFHLDSFDVAHELSLRVGASLLAAENILDEKGLTVLDPNGERAHLSLPNDDAHQSVI